MAQPDIKPRPPEKKSSAEKSELVDLNAENGDHVEPPPPEVVEPDPEMSSEQSEQARKDYLLTRYWISARGYWGKSGGRLAWLFTIGLLILMKRDSATVYYLTGVFFPLAIGSVLLGVTQVFARMGIQRRWRAWLTGAVISRCRRAPPAPEQRDRPSLFLFAGTQGRLPACALLAWRRGNYLDLLLLGLLGFSIASLLTLGHIDLPGFGIEYLSHRYRGKRGD
jgi:hypothetical protein